MPTTDHFIAAAWEAAPAFGLEPVEITLLSHSENVVCDVMLPDGPHLVMRLHRPGYNTLDELRSEVGWVRSLREAGLPVPTAVPTVVGDHYATVDIGEERRHVGVVEWVAGRPIRDSPDADGDSVIAHYSTIGTLSARIRSHSSSWTAPAGFTRRRWDCDGFVGERPLWGRFWEVEALTGAQRALLASARDELRDELGALSTGPDRFGLIHADLHLGNVMADGDELTVIDFDDAGFGWFAYEMAVALHAVSDEPWYDGCRAALLEGYRAAHPLEDDEEAVIDAFITMRTLMLVGWLDARRDLGMYEHFGELAVEATAAAESYLSA